MGIKLVYMTSPQDKGAALLPDSNITKRALASALKELMRSQPFSKISVSDICEYCDMNRKSFYYHFKDKYDLINWIYDTEFIVIAVQTSYRSFWDFLEDLCEYFYENRSFYHNALQITGQNSFSEHFRELLQPTIRQRLTKSAASGQVQAFQTNFFSDALICALMRWLKDVNCVPPREFLSLLQSCIEATSSSIDFSTESSK